MPQRQAEPVHESQIGVWMMCCTGLRSYSIQPSYNPPSNIIKRTLYILVCLFQLVESLIYSEFKLSAYSHPVSFDETIRVPPT